MKNSIKLFNRLTVVLLMVLYLFSLAVPVVAEETSAAPEDIRYGIVIECSYSDIEDTDTVDRSIYKENVFLLSSKTSELYAVADYSAENQTYTITGYTADENAATRFRCGTDAKLRISGIAPDSYILDQVQTAAGYTLIFSTEVDFSTDTPMVNDSKMDTSIAPDTGEVITSVSIQLAKGFDLPGICGSYHTHTILALCGTLLIVCVVGLVIIFRCWRRNRRM